MIRTYSSLSIDEKINFKGNSERIFLQTGQWDNPGFFTHHFHNPENIRIYGTANSGGILTVNNAEPFGHERNAYSAQ